MFCILPCAVVKDKVTLSPVGEASSIAKEMDTTRSEIRKLSDIEYLLKRLHSKRLPFLSTQSGFGPVLLHL